MRIKRISTMTAVLMLALLVAAPSFAAARGAADFSRLAAIGDSYGAGFESASLNLNHQPYGWPTIIAKQVGQTVCPTTATATDNCFAVPLISYPGLGSGPGELILSNIISYPPVITPAPGSGSPLMLNFGRPYNNLAVPGYTVGAAMTLTGKEANSGLGQLILRGLGSEVDQALSLHPTFILVWLGGNDFLGSVTNGTSEGMTSTADFQAQYGALLDKLIAGAPQAGMVVGTLPASFTGVPFVSTVSRFIINPATRQPVLGPDGNPVAMIGVLDNGAVGQIPAGSYVTLGAASLLGSGYGIPPTLAPLFPSLPNAGKPLPASVVITPAEASTIAARIADYNNIIKQSASSRNIPVADVTGLFNRVGARKEQVGPINFTGDFITGGFFSLDGIHLTDMGYTLFADEFIKAINDGYGTHIPLAGLSDLLANNGAFFPKTSSGAPFFEGMEWEMSMDAARALQMMLVPQSPSRRLRAVSH